MERVLFLTFAKFILVFGPGIKIKTLRSLFFKNIGPTVLEKGIERQNTYTSLHKL